MLFNSLPFLYYFVAVFLFVWGFQKKILFRNIILLAASYYFYCSWEYKFAIVLASVTIFSYLMGLWIATTKKAKGKITLLNVILLLSFLLFFKYKLFGKVNFFQTYSISNWALPIGMSYFTLVTIGYLIDIYKQKIVVEKNFVTYATYLSFFPQLLSGPISQASKLLPQFRTIQVFSKKIFATGVSFIAWGLFKKVIVSSSISLSVSYVFKNHTTLHGSDLFIGLMLYSCQVYADFSGYSDIAFGLATLLGFQLIQNFKMPFFSSSISEFWRKWHVSLSTWLREYIYIPLGGNHLNFISRIGLLLFTFTMSGAWHGATFNFLIWGFLNGFLYVIELGYKNYFSNKFKIEIPPIIMGLIVFISIGMTRVWFYSPTFDAAISFYKKMFSISFFSIPDFGLFSFNWVFIMLLCSILYLRFSPKIEAFAYQFYVKIGASIFTLALVIWYMNNHFNSSEYIYFKF